MLTQYLLRVSQAHTRLNLPQAIRNPKDTINQRPIGRALNLEVPKQSVRTKKRDGLIKDIIVLAVWVDIKVAYDR